MKHHPIEKTLLVLFGTLLIAGPSYALISIVPQRGQDREQQTRDIGECNAMARQKTGLNLARRSRDDAKNTPEVRAERQQQVQTYNQIVETCLQERGYVVE
ncbi:hypothetical protein V0288_00500 [Pannus brasiliensis CCIBt3594]|uniref:Glycine zipper family protein n=1 Tax=Pannus brasiliensis CCIBt3594 TaxID=1427578 RepID=A0AAW9QCY2_9CHRO